MPRKKKAAANTGSTGQPRPTHYDIDQVRTYARGQWDSLLSLLGGIDASLLDGNHHHCPKCPDGGTDRFRFTNLNDDGSIICNQCCRHEAGNGFLALSWATGKTFHECLVMVAEHFGVPPSNDRANYKANGSDKSSDPADHLKFQDWDEQNEMLAKIWCLHKEPITLEAIKLCGGRFARYTYFEKTYSVIALPVWGQKLKDAEPVGWSIWNASGHNLPKKGGWVKVKLTAGSREPGLIGPVDRIAAATTIWKLEGPSDLLAFYSLPDIPEDVVAVTNKAGAAEKPADWIPPLFAGKTVNVLHDADKPGQDGASAWLDPVSRVTAETWHVTLPYEVKPDHGSDLRDYLKEQCSVAHDSN